MKVLYGKELAIYTDPESCGGSRKAAAEALTGEDAGQVLSLEEFIRSAVPVQGRAGNTRRIATARYDETPRGRRPCARIETPHTEAGESHRRPEQDRASGPRREPIGVMRR